MPIYVSKSTNTPTQSLVQSTPQKIPKKSIKIKYLGGVHCS